MDVFISNLVNLSFEHVLHSYGIHIVSTYTYEVGNCIFDFISYLLDQISSLEVSQNSMTHWKSMFINKYRKGLTMLDSKIKSKYSVYLHQGRARNEHEYVIKMA